MSGYKCLRARPRKREKKEKPSEKPFDGFSYVCEQYLVNKTDFVYESLGINKANLGNNRKRDFILNRSKRYMVGVFLL